MSVLVSGLIGAVVSFFMVRWIAGRIRVGAGDGTLAFAPFLERLGLLQLLAVAFLTWLLFSRERDSDAALIVLILALLAGGVYCLAEGMLTRGSFDDAGIVFSTPWGGRREELWRDLLGVSYCAPLAWYVLRFRSGRKIRLSVLLSGHGGVVARLRGWGYHV